MNHQTALERFLDRSLDSKEMLLFEEHLSTCEACREATKRWQDTEARLVAIRRARVPPERSEVGAQQLLLRARAVPSQARPPRFWLVRPIALAGLAATLALVAVYRGFVEPVDDASGVLHWQALGDRGGDSASGTLSNRDFVAPESLPLRLRIEGDHIGLRGGSRVKVARATQQELRLTLEKGQIACEIEPRTRRARVVVDADGFSVVVVGTRFSVSVGREGVDVAVERGQVVVEGPAGLREPVTAGSQVRFGSGVDGAIERRTLGKLEVEQLRELLELPVIAEADAGGLAPEFPTDSEPPTQMQTTANPSRPRRAESAKLDRWRSLILDGQLSAAQRGLERYSRSHPSDVDGWLLLADVRRKAGQFEAAVRAYRKAIALDDPSAANQARFLAGMILQDQLGAPAAAAQLFEAYLAQGAALRPLEAAALLRTGRAYLALENPDRARLMLLRVVDEHPSSSVAAEASTLLKQLGATPQ